MSCRKCGHAVTSTAKFCINCGSALAITCPRCGAQVVVAAATFCDQCGAPLTPTRLETPEHLVAEAPASGPYLEGERKQITVLFVDVVGSMDLQEHLGDEAWGSIIDRFTKILSETVRRFEGTVQQFTGDGVMAYFGAPVAHEDHARRACYCALEMVEAIRRYAEDLKRTDGLGFHVRIGINSGEVVVATIGNDAHMEYTAIGHTVGLAKRMESLAAPGRPYLTSHTARLVEGFLQLKSLGEFSVKGVDHAVAVFELLGVGPLRTPIQVSQGRGFSTFVGRDRETAILGDALVQASQGQAQVIGVVGEPGVGKSRLCAEFAAQCTAKRLTVLRAHGVSHGMAIPFLPILELLRDYFGILDNDSPGKAREKIAGQLLSMDAAPLDGLPLFFDFLEVVDPERPPPALQREARMRRLFEFIRRVIERRSASEGLTVFLLEDLHWFDPASAEFLEQLIESWAGSRTLVLTNFRPGFSAPWTRHSYYRQIPLAPLSPAAVKQMLEEVLGLDRSLGGLPDFILDRTRGNPFFVEETVRSLIEQGTLDGDRGGYRLVTELSALAVPATVQALLSARIDRVEAREKSLLQKASVIGRVFTEPVLGLVTELSNDELSASLHSLCSAEFLQQQSLYPVAEYRFWHPLTQEVAYGSLLRENRARIHAAVAKAVAELEPEGLDEHAALLAQHWEAAGEPLEAAHWHLRAAIHSGWRDVYEQKRHLSAMIGLLAKVKESDESFDLGWTARFRLMRIAARLGAERGEVDRLGDEARDLAERRGDQLRVALTYYAKGFAEMGAGQLDRALANVRAGIDIGAQIARKEVALTRVVVGFILASRGPLPEALKELELAVKASEGDIDFGLRLFGISMVRYRWFFRSLVLWRMGRLVEAAADAERAMEFGRQSREPEMVLFGKSVNLLVSSVRGEGKEGVSEARQAARTGNETSPLSAVYTHWALGAICLDAELYPEAHDALAGGLRLARRHSVGLNEEAALLALLADVRVATGNAAAAAETAQEAVEIACKQNAGVHECRALISRAAARRALRGLDARDTILADLDHADALIAEVGAHVWSPFVHVERAELAQLDGDRAARVGELREALRLFQEMGASGRAARIEQAISATAVERDLA